MALTINRRVSGEIEGEFVLFLIGVRLNKPWKLNWLPVFRAMPRMRKELSQKPDLGMMHYRVHFGFPNTMVAQYWRSFEQLTAYAQDRNQLHLPAWSAFNKAISNNGDVGIWHETYIISPGKSESIYINMPKYGLGAAGTLHDSTGRRANAKNRMNLNND
jgi:Domain of unknown function (DUF4188)